MNDAAGGNARWGENEITAYPWAAHYIPIPGPKAIYVRELFEDLGVLQNGVWNDRYLCFSPQERLFLYGRWQEGIEPAIGLKPSDREQFQRLEEIFTTHRKSGEFTIPLELGRSQKSANLDKISFADWLRDQKFDSPLVNWYMNYACRDDYGALAKDTSAWAGIHYFSSREQEEKGPLTWPEGNGWITRRLLERVGENVRTNQMVRRIAPSATKSSASSKRALHRHHRRHAIRNRFRNLRRPNFPRPLPHRKFPRAATVAISSLKPSATSPTPPGSPPISHSTASPTPATPNPPGTPSSSTRQPSATSTPHTNPSAPTSKKPSGHSIGRSPTATPRKIAARCSKKIGPTGRKLSSTISSASTPTFACASRASTSCAWATPWCAPLPAPSSPPNAPTSPPNKNLPTPASRSPTPISAVYQSSRRPNTMASPPPNPSSKK